jgi:small conductance mechanosensitive channel
MQLTQTYLENLLEQAIIFLPKLFLAIVIFILSLYLARLTAKGVKHGLEYRKFDPELTLLLSRVSRWAVIIYGLIVALQQVDFNVSSFVAGLGIVGFALTFAFQDIAKNFIAGVLLLWQQPFDIGNAIEVSGYGGTVTNIEIRSTTISTWDGKHVIIPNADVYTSTITNFSRSPVRRLQLDVGVAYNSDLDRVTTIVQETLKNIEGILQEDKSPLVFFDKFSDSAIDLTIFYWIDTRETGYLEIKDRTLKSIKTALEQAGVEIPFPIRTVLMENK